MTAEELPKEEVTLVAKPEEIPEEGMLHVAFKQKPTTKWEAAEDFQVVIEKYKAVEQVTEEEIPEVTEIAITAVPKEKPKVEEVPEVAEEEEVAVTLRPKPKKEAEEVTKKFAEEEETATVELKKKVKKEGKLRLKFSMSIWTSLYCCITLLPHHSRIPGLLLYLSWLFCLSIFQIQKFSLYLYGCVLPF